MAKSPPKRRLLPKDITEKPDREVMERIFGKRAMRKVDETLQDYDGQDVTIPHNER